MISGITMNPDADPQVLKAIARQVEELGFSYCYVADQGLSRDVYVTLSNLAASTTSLRLGPGITHPYVRHPAATAVAIATLDELSHHRAFLGIGAGGTRALAPSTSTEESHSAPAPRQWKLRDGSGPANP